MRLRPSKPVAAAVATRRRGGAALAIAAAVALLAACASKPPPKDDTPTLKLLEGRHVTLPADQGVKANDEATIAAYREYLKKAPADAQRPEALRRLGDLEMESADSRLAGVTAAPARTAEAPVPAATAPSTALAPVAPSVVTAPSAAPPAPAVAATAPARNAAATAGTANPQARSTLAASAADAQNYQRAVGLYQDLLKTYPQAPDNDKVLYQLAHAYELGGDLEAALRSLDRLVHDYPRTPLIDEVQFRRGELMFTMRNYHGAELAYATIIANPAHTPYFERALYMHGWSLYKQDELEEALKSFFGVLDLKLIARDSEAALDVVPGLTRADRELVDDTLRVISLCLENLKGAETIASFMGTGLRRDYEFRVYRQLGELYLAQERTKDAADTFLAFAHRYPLHLQAPALRARVIQIYQRAGFETLVLEAKRDYVERYGLHGEFHAANPEAWKKWQPLVKDFLTELAQRDHALAQKSRRPEDYQVAAGWYRQLIEAFPADPNTAQANFLLAELLFESHQFAAAATEYENTAYHYLPHAKSADAGYAALLAYVEQEKAAGATPAAAAIVRTGVESALRFADAFPGDARDGPVLANAAERLYALHDLEGAGNVAHRVLRLKPPAAAAQQRVAWTVIALAAFDGAAYDQAEQAYTELLARVPEADPQRGALTERLAASVYKQGEQARSKGDLRAAVGHFERVAVVAPQSPVRAAAQYDAAAALIALKDWPAAARTLEDFRQRYAQSPLLDEAGDKLALVYTESAQWALAAGEYERVAARKGDDKLARAALWQAAELYDKAAAPAQGGAGAAADAVPAPAVRSAQAAAARVYEQYVQRYPAPLDAAIEARARLARLATAQGDAGRALAWTRQLLFAEQAGGAERTDHSRYLGAQAALLLSQQPYQDFHGVALVEPLKKQLALKKARMEEALKAFAVAANYGVADVATDATFHTAEIYREFGQSLMSSERPKGLSPDELEQYNVLLEEQAFPFEEKAVAAHELNARHCADGIYDQWVRSSYRALAQLRPLRYGKQESSEDTIDAIR